MKFKVTTKLRDGIKDIEGEKGQITSTNPNNESPHNN